ncbi:MAG: cyclase family protein [Salinirussus sp.]
MPELVDLSGYVEENQPALGSHDTVFWTCTTHEESGYRQLQELDEDDMENETLKRKLRAKREGSDELHPKDRAILMSEHGPTHVDSLAHIDSSLSESTIDKMDLDWFYGPAIGLDVSELLADRDYVTIDIIESKLQRHSLELREGDAITLHTGHRNEHYGLDVEPRYAYLNEYIGLDGEAATWLAERGVKNIGIDAPSIDHSAGTAANDHPAHDACGKHGMINTENMANLDAVAGRRYTLCCFPLKLRGGTGSPVRPVGILE